MIKREFSDAWQLAKNSIQHQKETNKKYYDLKTNILDVKIGDKILVKKMVKDRKFDYAWRGPYTVVETFEKYVTYMDGRKKRKVSKDYVKLSRAVHNYSFFQEIPETYQRVLVAIRKLASTFTV